MSAKKGKIITSKSKVAIVGGDGGNISCGGSDDSGGGDTSGVDGASGASGDASGGDSNGGDASGSSGTSGNFVDVVVNYGTMTLAENNLVLVYLYMS